MSVLPCGTKTKYGRVASEITCSTLLLYIEMRPSDKLTRDSIRRKSVVLPMPVGPISAVLEPGLKSWLN